MERYDELDKLRVQLERMQDHAWNKAREGTDLFFPGQHTAFTEVLAEVRARMLVLVMQGGEDVA